MVPRLVVGVAGGSGSGKSTLVDRLTAGPLRAAVAVLRHDAYYRDRAALPAAIQGNWDHPDALDNDRFAADLDRLCRGDPADAPVYDFTTHAPKPETVRIDPRPVLIAEGILLFAIPAVRDRLGLRVYVHTPAEERLSRRVLRDTAERGRTYESVLEQFRTTVRPMHDQYVEPSKVHAHLIVPWDYDPAGAENGPAVEVLLARIGRAIDGR